MPTVADAHRLEHAEIARRYRAKRKRRPRPTLAQIRVRELERLFVHRYGDTLPNDDAGRDDVSIMAHHLASTPGNCDDSITVWVQCFAPWYPSGDLKTLIEDASTNTARWKADRLARDLHLTYEDRTLLGIKTIGAIDFPKAWRIRNRRALKNAARQAARRAQGIKPRADYEQDAIARRKPWEDLGISRATWYRRRSLTPP